MHEAGQAATDDTAREIARTPIGQRRRARGIRVRHGDACPDAANHTPSPDGYLAWHAWAARMGQGHRQVTCAVCGLYAVWIRRGTNERVTERVMFEQGCLTCRPAASGEEV